MQIGLFNCTNIEERIRMILIMSEELFDHENFDKNYAIVFIDTVEKCWEQRKEHFRLYRN